MSHLTGRCGCGRTVHLPKNAKPGHTWKCHACGASSVVSDRGKSLRRVASRPPRLRHEPKLAAKAPKSEGSPIGGVALVILMLAAILSAILS